MDYATAVRWVEAMNTLDHGAGYLGHNNWQLPTAPTRRQELRTYGTARRIVRVPLFGQRAGISLLRVRWVFASRTRPFASPPIRSAHSAISNPICIGRGLRPPIRSKDL